MYLFPQSSENEPRFNCTETLLIVLDLIRTFEKKALYKILHKAFLFFTRPELAVPQSSVCLDVWLVENVFREYA